MKKLLCGILATVMAFSMVACGEKDEPVTETSSKENTSEVQQDPILTGEKPELKILSMYQTYNYEDQPSYKLLEELTGYKTKWFALPAENPDQKLMLEISSGADYDLLLRMNANGYSQLSNQNALIDLDPILKKYGTNILDKVSDFAWTSTTNSDGIVGAIPHENHVASPEEPYGMLTGGIGIRSDVLEELDTTIPTTLDEFTKLLEDAKAKYGITPLTANKNSAFVPAIMSAFGMGDAEWYDVDGTYTHRIKHPELPNYLAYLQKLYKEKLLDTDMPINTGDNAKEKFASKNAVAIAPLMFWDIPSMLNAISTSNPDCKAVFATTLAKDENTKGVNYIRKGATFFTCVSQYSKNPEHAINWLNILSTDENFRRVYIGEEGISYEMIDGGYHPIFNDADKDHDFTAYANGDKFAGFCVPTEGFKMWQARARKTPEMADAYEQMNSRVDEVDAIYSIETYGKTAPAVQEYVGTLGQAFADSFLKALVDGVEPDKAIAEMQAEWDKNGGLEMEKAMQEFYNNNKQYAK